MLTLKPHEWPRQNFSWQHQYNIKQTSDENKEKDQLGDYYRNFRSFTRTADYPHRPIIAYGEKKSQQITRSGG